MKPYTLLKSAFHLCTLSLALFPFTTQAQQPLSKVYTDYKGFWSSGTTSINADMPDASHMLLGFTYKNTTYSTGVNDALLTSKGVNYVAGNFEALSLANSAINSTGSVIGVGDMYGGSSGGNTISTLAITNNLASYLNDGIHGLDLGTAIFNMPAASSLYYPVNNFNTAAIGDNIPDILLTQVGQPPTSGSPDAFHFEDSLGRIVGNVVSVNLAGIDVVGNGKWKFYNPGNPITYNASLQGSRPLRMVGFDLADFGLTAADFRKVARFVHKLSGQSDQAFIAYNATSFTAAIGIALPVKLVSFQAAQVKEQAKLSWSIAEAKNFDHFEIERSAGNAADFAVISTINAMGDEAGSFEYTDAQPVRGDNYYRLKMIDQNGDFTYSPVRSLKFDQVVDVTVYPNPATSVLYLNMQVAADWISLYNAAGQEVAYRSAGTEHTSIDVSTLPQGIYTLHIRSAGTVTVKKITVAH